MPNRYKPIPPVERFRAFVDDSGGPDACWLWKGAVIKCGYALFRINRGKKVYAHRYAYELWVGPIPEGLDLLHSCDVKNCVNPRHLSPGDAKENLRQMMERGRCTYAKLTSDDVREIRRLYDSGECTQTVLAEFYNVAHATIGCVVRRTRYKHVAEVP